MYPMKRHSIYKLLAIGMLLIGTAAFAYPTVAKICEMRMQPAECPMHETNSSAPENCCSMTAIPGDVTSAIGASTSTRLDEGSIAVLTSPLDLHLFSSSSIQHGSAPTTAPPPIFLKTTVLLI